MKNFHVEIYNQQAVLPLADDFLKKLSRGLELIGQRLQNEGQGDITALEIIEIVLLDDCEMARVHDEFLQDATTTDVITFEHGEILIGVEVAARQRLDYGHSLEREIFLYGIHGLLHLAAYDDHCESDRAKMWSRQDELLAEFGVNW